MPSIVDMPTEANAQSTILSSYSRHPASRSVMTLANWATVAVLVGVGVGDEVADDGCVASPQPVNPTLTKPAAAISAVNFGYPNLICARVTPGAHHAKWVRCA